MRCVLCQGRRHTNVGQEDKTRHWLHFGGASPRQKPTSLPPGAGQQGHIRAGECGGRRQLLLVPDSRIAAAQHDGDEPDQLPCGWWCLDSRVGGQARTRRPVCSGHAHWPGWVSTAQVWGLQCWRLAPRLAHCSREWGYCADSSSPQLPRPDKKPSQVNQQEHLLPCPSQPQIQDR